MTHTRHKRLVHSILERAEVEIGGSRPHDIRVIDDRFFNACVSGGFSGIRDAYVDGWWDTDRLDELTFRVMSSGIDIHFAGRFMLAFAALKGRLANIQKFRTANQIQRHYDRGDDLFEAMLDSRMIYSCAYWQHAATLDEAQEAKLDLICRKLALRPGARILDIGCGWGGLARYAAERYGVSVVGLTLSQNQARMATATSAALPIEIRMADYRVLSNSVERFDAIASVGMFEHVGYKNYRDYFQLIESLLLPDGLFLLQTIGGNTSRTSYDPWMSRHIFPNAHLPSARQIATAAEGLLLLEDWHSFGADYDRTLMSWHANFQRSWPNLCARYSERFRRMWTCYLLTCAGSFRARINHLWQIVFSKAGRKGTYVAAR